MYGTLTGPRPDTGVDQLQAKLLAEPRSGGGAEFPVRNWGAGQAGFCEQDKSLPCSTNVDLPVAHDGDFLLA